MNKKQLELWKKKYGEANAGYAENFEANDDFLEMGLVCHYEHCIEHMDFLEEQPEKSCPVFGHDCPGKFDREECKKLRDFFMVTEEGHSAKRVLQL